MNDVFVLLELIGNRYWQFHSLFASIAREPLAFKTFDKKES